VIITTEEQKMIEDRDADPMKWRTDIAPKAGWIFSGGKTVKGHDKHTRKFRQVYFEPGETYQWRGWSDGYIETYQYMLPDGAIIENKEYVGGD
jgi:hypothetical protein